MSDMTPITLERTGNTPVVFTGRRLALVDGKDLAGTEHNRWHEVRIYQTQAGAYLAYVEYNSNWQGEAGRSMVFREADMAGLSRALLGHEPAFYVQGYPPGDAYNDKQARLIRDVTDRFKRVAGRALTDAGAEERID